MPQFPIIIAGVDHLTAMVDRINKKLEAINAPVERLRKSFTKLGDVSGLNRLTASFGRVARYALDAFRNIGRIVAPLGAITGALSVAGMAELVRHWADFGMHLGFAARRIGLTSAQLHGLEGAARLSGASAQGLDNGMRNLADAMTDAIGGRNPEALLYLNTLRIQFRDVRNHARSVTDVMPEIADKIATIKDPILQARVATELFGSAGEELLPFLRRGSAGIQEYVQQAQRYGLMNEKATAAALRLHQAQERVSMAVEGFTNRLAERLEPILGPILDHFAEWIATSQEGKDAIDGLARGVKGLADWLAGIDWQQVGAGIKSFVSGANDAAQAVGGWGRAVEILFGLWVSAKFAGVLANVLKLRAAMAGVAGRGPAAAAAASGTGGAGLGILGLGSALTLGTGYLGEAVEGWALRQLGMRAPDEYQWMNGPMGGQFVWPMYRRAEPGANAVRPGASNDNRAAPEMLGRAGSMASRVMGYFERMGWSHSQAAGIASNLQSESGFNAGSIGDGGQAYGVAQWHPDRQANFARFAGHDIRQSTLDEQLAFVNYELTQGAERRAGQALKAANDAAAAGAIVSRLYERPGDAAGEMARRGGLAARLSAQAPPADLAPLSGVSGAPGPNGKLDVTVRHANPPAGASLSVKSSGSAVNGTPKIERAMSDFEAA